MQHSRNSILFFFSTTNVRLMVTSKNRQREKVQIKKREAQERKSKQRSKKEGNNKGGETRATKRKQNCGELVRKKEKKNKAGGKRMKESYCGTVGPSVVLMLLIFVFRLRSGCAIRVAQRVLFSSTTPRMASSASLLEGITCGSWAIRNDGWKVEHNYIWFPIHH